ncbi:metal-dependent hydrolase [Aestuariirhabdus litorea]|uniref:Metal-dependent hydrolase n=1 Tax=Aestuariirhabdus litorea TaxID=2528527 RepID=A0A3P3VNV9_9GAMM|nr:metal-dependent hydrolase [Aestuariirhabdus litorea]RRJ84385.1 metal-dependent hydrolase [Aestuariirhabdus litorea]RWW97609.1 metal-dependent hydrolase [Endozoicomonadaceae bacterium GTF-13]
MDPVTQGVLGATLAQAASKPKLIIGATLLGIAGGMAPDLDVLIRSETDPLLYLEYHRQFTHSLFFIPFGGVLVGLLMHALLGRHCGLRLWQSLLFATLGYATHALLDACTTYGTQLLWPFSNARIAWNTLSIIDPLYTLPLLGLVITAAVKKRPQLGRIALAWALIYPGIGALQRERAEALGWEIAAARGHEPVRLEAKPSFANLLVWKIVYETEDRYFVDAVRVGINSRTYPGQHVAKLDIPRDLPWLDPASQQAQDIERFRWFSNGYIARDPEHPNRVVDIRYSVIPNEIKALWGIELNPGADPRQHVRYHAGRDTGQRNRDKFWQMVFD